MCCDNRYTYLAEDSISKDEIIISGNDEGTYKIILFLLFIDFFRWHCSCRYCM